MERIQNNNNVFPSCFLSIWRIANNGHTHTFMQYRAIQYLMENVRVFVCERESVWGESKRECVRESVCERE